MADPTRSRGLFTRLVVAVAAVLTAVAVQAAPSAAERHPSRAFWLDIKSAPAAFSNRGARQSVHAKKFRSITLDRLSIAGMVSAAPHERSRAARTNPLVISLPIPPAASSASRSSSRR